MAFNPEGVVLPISAAILEDLPGYRAALEDYSSTTLPGIDWEATVNGNVTVSNDTAYLYRYFDATRQAEYLVDRVERTIRFSMPAELAYLHRFDDAKRRLAQVVDMPDRLSSLFIQLLRPNRGATFHPQARRVLSRSGRRGARGLGGGRPGERHRRLALSVRRPANAPGTALVLSDFGQP